MKTVSVTTELSTMPIGSLKGQVITWIDGETSGVNGQRCTI
jgi:hypothetical protein